MQREQITFEFKKENEADVFGCDINEIVYQVVARIRPISKEFYNKELRNDLKTTGESWVDIHAGCGIFYNVFLKS